MIDTKALALKILQEKAVVIRDVDGGEKPFLYSSGNWGPGYCMIKGLVGKKWLMEDLVHNLAIKVAAAAPKIEFVAANATGGMVPGWILSNHLERKKPLGLDRPVPYVYVRGTRKKGGHGELVTGIENNDLIGHGQRALVVEELVNFAETTCNSAEALRELGYEVTHAACILFYDNPVAKQRLKDTGVELIYLLTLPEILAVAEAEKTHAPHVIQSYRDFLADPKGWQAQRGLKLVASGGTQ